MAQGGVRLRRGWSRASKLAAAIAVAVLGACAEPAAKLPPPPAPVVTPPPPPPAPTPPRPPAPPKDACGASPLQSLVGRPRTEIPVPVYPGRRRVVCSTCVMTQDYNPGRLTIIFDSNTGLVKSVRCG
jgi:hypothetical protein